jgi:hypothetical protein
LAAANSGFKKLAVQWLNEVLCSEIANFLNPQTFMGNLNKPQSK